MPRGKKFLVGFGFSAPNLSQNLCLLSKVNSRAWKKRESKNGSKSSPSKSQAIWWQVPASGRDSAGGKAEN